MDPAFLALGWLLFGLAGSALWLEFGFRRGGRGIPMLEIRGPDVLFAAGMALAGPMNFCVGLLVLFFWCFGRLTEWLHS